MRQLLGSKKHARCEALAGRKFDSCLTRGGWPHHVALCIEAVYDAEKPDLQWRKWWVNYRTGDVEAYDTSPRTPPAGEPKYTGPSFDEAWSEAEKKLPEELR